MATKFLTMGRILVVRGPKSLPSDVDHATAISALCRDAKLVLLFSFGDDKYKIPPSFTLPTNARLIDYDYETLDESVDEVSEAFALMGAQFVSRHQLKGTMPFVLSGGVISLPPGTSLEFYDNQKTNSPTSVDVDDSLSTWSIDG
jgi:hypothetical protein